MDQSGSESTGLYFSRAFISPIITTIPAKISDGGKRMVMLAGLKPKYADM